MGEQVGTGGGGRHVDAVFLLSSTLLEGDQVRYDVGRPWHYPLLVEQAGLA